MENQSLQPKNELVIPEIPGIENFDMAEWVFQFDDEEPVVIAWSNSEEVPGELSFVLKPNSGSNVIFQSADGTKKMSIFSRRMPDGRRLELRELKIKEEEIINKLNSELLPE
jgi:hypothetical protein